MDILNENEMMKFSKFFNETITNLEERIEKNIIEALINNGEEYDVDTATKGKRCDFLEDDVEIVVDGEPFNVISVFIRGVGVEVSMKHKTLRFAQTKSLFELYVEDMFKIEEKVVDYLTDYAREKAENSILQNLKEKIAE